MTDYLLCGWRVRSEIPLPAEIENDWGMQCPNVIIRRGVVPDTLPNAIQSTPFLQVAPDGTCRLDVAAAGRYLIRAGSEVVVQAAAEASDAEVRLFLLGTVLGMLAHQRGFFPLHASCVRVNGRALAFCGDSGAGKSTLAATLVRRGHTLICDDIAVIAPSASAGPMVWPALPRMRIWRDALDRMAVPSATLERDRIQLEKFLLPASSDTFATEPVPLAGIYSLVWDADLSQPALAALAPMDTVIHLTHQVYRHRPALAMGRQAALFQAAGQIAARVPVKQLRRPKNLARLDDTACFLEHLVSTWGH